MANKLVLIGGGHAHLVTLANISSFISRGHEVTAVVRDSSRYDELPRGVNSQTGDASNADDISRLSEGQDVLISAIRPAPGRESEIVPTTQALLDGLARTGVRLLVVGGAACLTVPNSGGTLVIEASVDGFQKAVQHISQ